MIKEIDGYSLKVIVGRKNFPVPVVNDIYLHSLYDPLKEADSFVQKNKNRIFQKNYFLILGLGFVYHVNRLIEELKKRGSEKWGVVVIEPNAKIFKECVDRKLITEDSRLKIFNGMDIEELYAKKKLIDFMVLKPIVLVHETSYNLYLNYYKKFLNYRAPCESKEISNGVKNQIMQEYLLNCGEQDIFGLKDIVKNKSTLEKEEMLMGAFFAICENGKS